jgi:hypothetical protein
MESRAQARRNAVYEKTLRSYADALQPGLTRSAVEHYLRAKNVTLRRMCCVDHKSHSYEVYDDLVEIGREDAPWFCSENNVYIAFQFAGERANTGWSAEPNDRLTEITVYHWLEGCV